MALNSNEGSALMLLLSLSFVIDYVFHVTCLRKLIARYAVSHRHGTLCSTSRTTPYRTQAARAGVVMDALDQHGNVSEADGCGSIH